MKNKLNLVIAVLLSGWVIISTSCKKADDLVPSSGHGMAYQGGDIQPLSDYNDLNDESPLDDEDTAADSQWVIGTLTPEQGTLGNFNGHHTVISDPGVETSQDVLSK